MSDEQQNITATEQEASKAEELEMEQQHCGWLNEFLWTCAGVNKKVLRQCHCDYAKYAGIGGTILFTALMASLSGGYALSFVFNNGTVAIAFGIFWGLLIFNLDRFIVNTMYSDGKHTISWAELKSGLPRIIMAIFLGVVISTPLELKIFEDAIDIQIEQDKDDMVRERIKGEVQRRDSIAQRRLDVITNGLSSKVETTQNATQMAHIDALNATKSASQKRVEDLDAQISQLNTRENLLKKDRDNQYAQLAKCSSAADSLKIKTKINAISQNIKVVNGQIGQKRKERSDASSSISQASTDIAAAYQANIDLARESQSKIDREAKRLENEAAISDSIIHAANERHTNWTVEEVKTKGSIRDKIDVEYKGFQAKMQAFSELKAKSVSTQITAIFVMMLFIIIETAPTFFKMMMEDGPYDHLLKAEKHCSWVLSQEKISLANDDINKNLTISTMKNKKLIEAETLANECILKRIAEVQAELLQTSISAWRAEELQKIKENPSSYLKIGQSKHSKLPKV
jgi:hypothetical protein